MLLTENYEGRKFVPTFHASIFVRLHVREGWDGARYHSNFGF